MPIAKEPPSLNGDSVLKNTTNLKKRSDEDLKIKKLLASFKKKD